MFGIGMPELLVIMVVALLVVGPDKLPDLAKSIARQILELKKTANTLKASFQEEMERGNPGPQEGQAAERLLAPDAVTPAPWPQAPGPVTPGGSPYPETPSESSPELTVISEGPKGDHRV